MLENKVFIFHVIGLMTIAVKRCDDDWKAAVSVCNERDNFSRKMGRTIAEGRLSLPYSEYIRRHDKDLLVAKAPNLGNLINELEDIVARICTKKGVRSTLTASIYTRLNMEIPETITLYIKRQENGNGSLRNS